MQIKTKEHYELIKEFEKSNSDMRLDKEAKELWVKGQVYQDGNVNKLFINYRLGYALAKSLFQ